MNNAKDWTGNSISTFSTLGAKNYSLHDRANNDFYATEPKAVEELLKVETFSSPIWECACGAGHISEVLKHHGYEVFSTDLIDRGYGEGCLDFLTCENGGVKADIVTNPPYKYAKAFVDKALNVIAEGHKAAMLLRIQFLESKSRRELFDRSPPKVVYVFSNRIACALNGKFDGAEKNKAMCFAWFVWVKGYNGDTVVRWIN